MEVFKVTKEMSMDFGGESILQQDLVSDDLICKIKGLNPNLGRPMDEFGNGDPLYSRYAQYRDEIENAELVVIDANALNRSSIMNLDLTGDTTGIDELPSDYFQLIDDTLQIAWGADEFGVNDLYGEQNEFNGFSEFTAFGDTQYSPFSNGHY